MSGHPPLPAIPINLPLLPLRDVVVFPHMVIPLFVGRPKSIKALEAAMEAERRIMLVAQKTAAKDDPLVSDMFDVGCVSTILQMLKLPDGTVKVLVEGQQRASITSIEEGELHFSATVTPIEAVAETIDKVRGKSSEIEALRRAVMQQFDLYVKLNKKIPPEILTSISSIDDAGRLADTIAAHLPLKLENKQAVLGLSGIKERLENLFEQIEREVDILNVDKKIRGRVKRQMEKNQRDFYLNEQVKAIQKELGEGEDGADIDEIEKKIKAAKMPKEALKKAEGEMKKLKLMSPMSAEATVVRNYIDVLSALPWAAKTWSVRPAWARHRLASQSPKPRAASMFAWRWVGCVMRLKFAATGALTSARCRAKCCKASRKSARATRCFFWMRSTSWAPTFGVTRQARCWRCWTRSRTTSLATITWKLTLTSVT